MSSFSPFIVPVTFAFAAAGIVLVLLIAGVQRGGERRTRRVNTVEMACTSCQRELVIAPGELDPISGAESALVVRERPEVSGRPLADYQCPYCEAHHTFTLDSSPPKWLITNAFSPEGMTNRCCQCHKNLKRPPWPSGARDADPQLNPDLDPDNGLVCVRCGAICCVVCCKEASRGRTHDRTWMCPRCFRGPLAKVHHF